MKLRAPSNLRLLLVAGLAVFGMSGQAQGYSHATGLVTAADAQHPYYVWVGMAKVPTPSGLITIEESTPLNCAEAIAVETACTDRESHIDIDPATRHARFWFLHELGHIYANGHPDLGASDDEWFANTYANCGLRKQLYPFTVQGLTLCQKIRRS